MTESNTISAGKPNEQQEVAALVVEHWEEIVHVLPDDLAASARATGAMQRRREIKEPLVLLRLVLLYALGFSVRLIGAWGVVQEVVDVSGVDIHKRLRQCQSWMGVLLGQMLQAQCTALAPRPGVRVCLVDATTVEEPGSKGTDWRVHLSLDLSRGVVADVSITDAHGGESLARFRGQADTIHIADRGYPFASSLAPHLAADHPLVVRANWQNLAGQTEEGGRFDVIAWLQAAFAIPTTTITETTVWLSTTLGRFPVRLIAKALPQEMADHARQRARTRAKKQGRTLRDETLYACGFMLLLTNLPAAQWTAAQVLDLYRLRWQVEVLFHRWKSLLSLAHLRAHDPRMVQTYLLAKLLLIVMCDAFSHTVMSQVPDWFISSERPVSPWRLTALAYQHVRHVILGSITWTSVLAHLPQLQRFLCDTPRRRLQQLATARAWLGLLTAPPMPLLS